MLTLISPLIKKFAFSNLLAGTKALELPFIESPSVPQDDDKGELHSAEGLFSLFTADIIKQEVVFTR